MTERDMLLRAVLENPACDTARLVFADWLDENGEEERAEFIRLQCELFPFQREREWLEQMPVEQWSGDEAAGALLRRLDPLVERHTALCNEFVRDCKGWSGEFIRGLLGRRWLAESAVWQWGWTRGFIGNIELPTAAFMRHAEALFRSHPITDVALTDREALDNAYDSEPTEWCWLSGERGEPVERLIRWELPRELWDGFESGHPVLTSPAMADEWLSQRCVAYGRRLAGLPPLS